MVTFGSFKCATFSVHRFTEIVNVHVSEQPDTENSWPLLFQTYFLLFIEDNLLENSNWTNYVKCADASASKKLVFIVFSGAF